MTKKAKNSLVGNINRHKKTGKSRSKKRNTISREAYDEMQQGWPHSKKKKATRRRTKSTKKAARK